ncbi:MAG TPA: hypothetical protein PLP23_14385 [Panacibacter sp.]|nr:hypothetical protein [Panacibacter sp.]
MRTSIFLFACIISFTACNQKPGEQAVTNTNVSYKAPDDEAITKAVADAYKVISFKKGEHADFENIKNYFIPKTQFINFRTDTAEILSLDEFIGAYKSFIEETHTESFYEKELYGRTDQFGKIAQRISTYATYLNTMDSTAERGVNSFQLIKTPQGWRVTSIIWDVEKPSLQIPMEYLDGYSTKP